MEDHNRHARRRSVAKKWRDTESTYINQLADLLPYPETIKSRMNKLDVMRLVKTFVYAKQLDDELGGSLESLGKANMIMDALNGFLISVDQEGLILYVSDHIYKVLGHHSYRMIGNNIVDYVHQDDTKRFFRHLKPETANNDQEQRFVVRMNYRITENSNKVKQSGYVGVHLRGTLRIVESNERKEKMGVLVAGCYIPCVTPCVQINYFESNYIMRFDKNDKLAYVENWIYDCWGVKARPFIGDHVKAMFNPADLQEWCAPYSFFHKRGVMVVSFHVITRAGHVFHGVTHDTMVFGSKGEKLFWVAVRYVNRVGKVEIKHWPGKQDLLVIGHSYGLPGEEDKRRPINSHVEDITDYTLPENNGTVETASSQFGDDVLSSPSKDVTLTEVNGTSQSVKDLLSYTEELDQDACSQDSMCEDNMCLENVMDPAKDIKEDGKSGSGITIHDFVDRLDLTMSDSIPVTDLQSDINDTMMDILNSGDELVTDIIEDNSSHITVLGDVSLFGDIEALSPTSHESDNFGEQTLSGDQSTSESFSTDDSNGNDSSDILEMGELSSVFAPEIMDFVLKDDQQRECQTWNLADPLDGLKVRHLTTTNYPISSSDDGELTLRDLLLKC